MCARPAGASGVFKHMKSQSPQRERPRSLAAQVRGVLADLDASSTTRDHDNLARFGITAKKAYGVSMANVQRIAKPLGRNHELAAALWDTGWYEARAMTAFVDDPAWVTPAQMDRWCRDFDNWGICDTLCFHLFDRTPHAWSKVEQWHDKRAEFVRRAAFALLASLALHDKTTGDRPFLDGLQMIERRADDERNFVKKGVSWALRAIGKRNPALAREATLVARRLSESDSAAARWIGKDAVREFSRKSASRRSA